jgi:hypothetical protein
MDESSPNPRPPSDHETPEPYPAFSSDDCFAPPKDPCECYCLHCGRVFSSDEIWLQKVIGGRDGFEGFWMCPTPNCSGAGFTFDIFPTDPQHPANDGWVEDDDSEFVDDSDPLDPEAAQEEWDPDETKYAELDEIYGEDDPDIEGEEWKFGLQPGETPPEPPWAAEARRHYEEEQKKYDQPDQRPREVDWSNRPDPPPSSFGVDDIPF